QLGAPSGPGRRPPPRRTPDRGAGGAAPAAGREPRAAPGARPAETSGGLLRQGERSAPVAVFRFIETEKAPVPVAFLCRALGVSPSGYYAWRTRPPAARAVADAALSTSIRQIQASSRGTSGAPRIQAALADSHQTRGGRQRVARLMRAAGQVGVCRRRGVRPIRRDETAPVSDDRVRHPFTAPAPHRLWVPTSPTCPPGKGSSISSWSSTRWRWPSGIAARRRGSGLTPITAAGPRVAPSGAAVGRPGALSPWGRSATAMTRPSRRASSPRWRASRLPAAAGAPAVRPAWLASAPARAATIRGAVTPPLPT